VVVILVLKVDCVNASVKKKMEEKNRNVCEEKCILFGLLRKADAENLEKKELSCCRFLQLSSFYLIRVLTDMLEIRKEREGCV